METIAKIAKHLDKVFPYLSVLDDNSAVIRTAALMRLVSEMDDFSDVILDIVTCASGISREELENAELSELFKLIKIVMDLNDWDVFWKAAHSMRIVETQTVVQWFATRIGQIRTT